MRVVLLHLSELVVQLLEALVADVLNELESFLHRSTTAIFVRWFLKLKDIASRTREYSV